MLKILNKINFKKNYNQEPKTDDSLELADTVYPEHKLFLDASTGRALFRAKKRDTSINSVIDIGASDGRWSKECMNFFPESRYFLIDANNCHRDALVKFCASKPKADFAIAAAGPEKGECFFDNSDPFGGVASSVSFNNAKNVTAMVSVDAIVKENNLLSPFLIKLDTHGFEPSILRGAKKTLKKAEIVIIEAYIFKLEASESVTFIELCNIMDSYGFRVGDFSEPLYRPKDMMLWQLDLFFYKKDNSVFKDNNYA